MNTNRTTIRLGGELVGGETLAVAISYARGENYTSFGQGRSGNRFSYSARRGEGVADVARGIVEAVNVAAGSDPSKPRAGIDGADGIVIMAPYGSASWMPRVEILEAVGVTAVME